MAQAKVVRSYIGEALRDPIGRCALKIRLIPYAAGREWRGARRDERAVNVD